MINPFSDTINKECPELCTKHVEPSAKHINSFVPKHINSFVPKHIDYIESRSLSPLKPFSETISADNDDIQEQNYFQELKFKYTTLEQDSSWWKVATKLHKEKGVPWQDIIDATRFSYDGRSHAVDMLEGVKRASFYIEKQRRWARILQVGWKEKHGEPGTPFKFARNDKSILPPRTGESVDSTFWSVVTRIRKQFGKKITDGDIAAALELYSRSGFAYLSTDQITILQTGWPHLFGPPGRNIPIARYHPDALQISNRFPEGTIPDYKTLKMLKDKHNFFDKPIAERKKILAQTEIYIKGYAIPMTAQTQTILEDKGFTKNEIKGIRILGKRSPDPGYKRYTKPDELPMEITEAGEIWRGWIKELIEIIGFVDLTNDLNRSLHPTFGKKPSEIKAKANKEKPSEPTKEPSEPTKKPSDSVKEKSPPLSLSAAQMRLTGSLSTAQKEKIRKMKKEDPEPGYKRIWDKDEFNYLSPAWIFAKVYGYVDIDKDGKLHPMFKPGAEKFEELNRLNQADIYYHPQVGYY